MDFILTNVASAPEEGPSCDDYLRRKKSLPRVEDYTLALIVAPLNYEIPDTPQVDLEFLWKGSLHDILHVGGIEITVDLCPRAIYRRSLAFI